MSVQIPLTRGLFTTIDEKYAKHVMAYKWHAVKGHNTFYVERMVKRRGVSTHIRLHRFILELSGENLEGKLVDHKNGNGLDNRLDNLRPCTRAGNVWNKNNLISTNTSGAMGVYRNKRGDRWIAAIRIGGKELTLGHFILKKDAINARAQAESTRCTEFKSQQLFLEEKMDTTSELKLKEELTCLHCGKISQGKLSVRINVNGQPKVLHNHCALQLVKLEPHNADKYRRKAFIVYNGDSPPILVFAANNHDAKNVACQRGVKQVKINGKRTALRTKRAKDKDKHYLD